MTQRNLTAVAVILAITVFGLFVYPGWTYLQSDTQIYVPVIEWLDDPSLYRGDLIPKGAHVSYTIYDEVSRGIRRVTGDLQSALQLQQFIYRACGVWGTYLLATAAGLAIGPALIMAFIASLGVTVVGPAILTVEYEPVPRGFAIGLTLLSLGLLAHGRYWPAGILSGLALLYHAPAVWPFWLFVPFLPRKKELLICLVVAIAILVSLSIPQTRIAEQQQMFATLSDEHARLQQMRASYNWVSLWFGRYVWFYLASWAISLVAFWRIRESLTPAIRILFLGMPVIGLLTMPASYLLLEQMRLALLPQLQPMRALLFVVLFAVLLAAIAAWKVKRWPERLMWLGIACVFPFLHGGQAPKKIETQELVELSAWARTSTPVDAVFLFPDEGKALAPGIFRARSLRSVYVDWKAGGQVNYFPLYAKEWWSRWNAPVDPPIDYVVLSQSTRPGETPVWHNSAYAVYKVR